MIFRKTKKINWSAQTKFSCLSCFLLLIYWGSNLPIIRNELTGSPYLSLLYWGAVVLLVLFFFPAIASPGRIRHLPTVKAYAFTGAIVYVSICFLVGVLLKQLKSSPYDLSLYGIFFNISVFFSAIFAREIIRGYTIGVIWKFAKHKYALIVCHTLLFTFIQINWGKLFKSESFEKIVTFIVSELMVILALNILATVLVFYGNSSAGIYFFFIIDGFFKLLPFIPELPWLATGAIGLVFPIVFSMFIMDSCKTERDLPFSKNKHGDASFLISLFLSVMFSWFCVGVFNIYPSIILTGSMEPFIKPGDVVIIKKMLVEDDIYRLKEGDIINFKRQDITITHRIEKITEDKAGNRTFQTKGDNNKSSDDTPVLPNDIKGIIVKTIPKVGIPILILKSNEPIPEGVIENDTTSTETKPN